MPHPQKLGIGDSASIRNLEKFKSNQRNRELITKVVEKEKQVQKAKRQAGHKATSVGPGDQKQYRIRKELYRSKPVPAAIRKDPFAEIPILTLDDLNKGLYTLTNQGYLGKNVDITQALQRNNPLIVSKRIEPNTVLFNDSILELNINEKKLFVDPITRSQSRNASHLTYPSAAMKTSEKDDLSRSRTGDAPQKGSTLITAPRPAYASYVPQSHRSDQAEPRAGNQDSPAAPDQHVRKLNQKYVEVVNGTVKKDATYLRLRSLHLMSWGDVEETLGKVVEFAAGQRILTFRLYLDKIQELGKLMREPTENEMARCIENYAKMRAFLKSMLVKSENSSREQDLMFRVAVKIQKNFRKLVARKLITKLADIQKKIKMIQFHLRLKFIHRETVARTRERNYESYQKFIQINTRFVEQWEAIAGQPRVEVHMNSLSRQR